MADKIFLRVGAWYKSTIKHHPSDIELSELIDDVAAQYPEIEIEGGGGTVSIPATAYASNADAVAALGVGELYKSTTLINGSPIILLTV